MTRRRRNSLRLQIHNYAETGAYFVTIVMHGREAILGSVVNKQIQPSRYGTVVTNVWKDLPSRYSHVVLDEFIIMPDHIHGIIWIHDPSTVGAGSLLTSPEEPDNTTLTKTIKHALASQQNTSFRGEPRAGYESTTKQSVNGLKGHSVNEPAPTGIFGLSEIIRNFKAVSAKRINLLRGLPNTPVWQRGFHDRIIRDESELNTIRQYIQTNPTRWSSDTEI